MRRRYRRWASRDVDRGLIFALQNEAAQSRRFVSLLERPKGFRRAVMSARGQAVAKQEPTR